MFGNLEMLDEGLNLRSNGRSTLRPTPTAVDPAAVMCASQRNLSLHPLWQKSLTPLSTGAMNWPLAACTKPSGNMIKLQEPRYRLSWWAAPRDFFSLTVESPPSAAHPCATVYCKIPPWLNCFLVSLFSYSDAKLTMFCMWLTTVSLI